ncbi:MAG: hypothetical protein ACRDYU_03835 [Actinomycetes bacterium]
MTQNVTPERGDQVVYTGTDTAGPWPRRGVDPGLVLAADVDTVVVADYRGRVWYAAPALVRVVAKATYEAVPS